jgi:Mg-chelatase subunit ChlD
MNFLTPWFLLGGVAIAGPILFHLIRRATQERVPFSSLMFLRPTLPRITRRRKLEHLWLLLLRCLALMLLATAFARPFIAKDIALPASPAEARQIVLLVDTSASMRREGLWNKARSLAESYLEKAMPADQFAVMTFDRQPRVLVSFAEWSSWAADQRGSLAGQRLAAVNPGWMNTQLGLALTSAAEQLLNDSAANQTFARREVVLISDLQEGAKLDGLQGHDWPTGVKVSVERVEPSQKGNVGLEILAESGSKSGNEEAVHVRVVNSRDSRQEKFQLNWKLASDSSAPLEIYLPPGQSRTFTAPKLPSTATTAELRLSGGETFADISYYAAPEFERVNIAWFGTESVNDPERLRYYIERVFPEASRQRVQVIRPYTNSAFSPALLERAAFAVIADKLASEEMAPMHDWLAGGKSALLVLSDAQMAPTLSALAGVPEIHITEAGGDYALLGEIDFSHPIFAPFADPRFSDFTHIHFWKHRRWEIPAGAPAHVLAKFDDGSPALTQLTVGKGNLLVFASGWNPSDSQLAVSSKFPPLMQRMLDWSGAASPMRFQFLTGDAIPSPGSAGVPPASSSSVASGMPSFPEVEWQKPDGKKLSLRADAPFTETDLPGIYTATVAGKQRHYAVNLPLDESRTAALAPDELSRLGVPLQLSPETSIAQVQAQQRRLQQSELENRQKLWRWLIGAVLAITLLEITFSGRLARRIKTAEVVA